MGMQSALRHPTTMRTPFDDPVFAAYADKHGVTRDDAPGEVERIGWAGNPKGPRAGLPDAFPRFVFTDAGQGIGAVLVIYLHYADEEPMVRYGRSPGGAWVHVETALLPATVRTTLKGRTVREMVDLPGVEDWGVAEVTEENGTVTMKLKRPGKMK